MDSCNHCCNCQKQTEPTRAERITAQLMESMNYMANNMVIPVVHKQKCHDRLVEMTKPLLAAFSERATYVVIGITLDIKPAVGEVEFTFDGKKFFPGYTVAQNAETPVDMGNYAYTVADAYLSDIQVAIDTVLLNVHQELV